VNTVINPRPTAVRASHRERAVGPSLVLGGIAFFVGGLLHPSDSGRGNKVLQLHDMLVGSSWYPAHAMLFVAMALFAGAVHAMRRRREVSPGVDRLLGVVFVVACVATVSMIVHLLAPLGASSVADGKPSLLSRVQTLNETVDAAWGLAVAALAAIGGLTRTAGNRLTIPLGLVGGLAFALASATIPYTDTFDPVFKIGSLLSVWAIAVGLMALRRAD
jgi:hypothetical protein